LRNYNFKVGDIVLHSWKAGFWIVDHIASNGAIMVKQVCTAEGKKRIGKQAIFGGTRCRPAQEMVAALQHIIIKYGSNGQSD
jgi:hypothetical protein